MTYKRLIPIEDRLLPRIENTDDQDQRTDDTEDQNQNMKETTENENSNGKTDKVPETDEGNYTRF